MRSSAAVIDSLSSAPSREEIVAITRGIAGRKGEDCEQLLAEQTHSGRLSRKASNRAHALKHRYRKRWISEQQQKLAFAFGALEALWDGIYFCVAQQVSTKAR
jgi:hypothetical protein